MIIFFKVNHRNFSASLSFITFVLCLYWIGKMQRSFSFLYMWFKVLSRRIMLYTHVVSPKFTHTHTWASSSFILINSTAFLNTLFLTYLLPDRTGCSFPPRFKMPDLVTLTVAPPTYHWCTSPVPFYRCNGPRVKFHLKLVELDSSHLVSMHML